jgi:hypothetical protein
VKAGATKVRDAWGQDASRPFDGTELRGFWLPMPVTWPARIGRKAHLTAATAYPLLAKKVQGLMEASEAGTREKRLLYFEDGLNCIWLSCQASPQQCK